jgi:cyclic-di-AMP phosphodiesterase PgpH
MGWFRQSNRQRTESSRMKRLGATPSGIGQVARDRSAWLNFGIYVLFTTLAVVICFVGLSDEGPLLQPNQISRIRVVARIDFAYQSEIEMAQLVEAQRKRVPPVYRLDMVRFDAFRRDVLQLVNELLEYAAVPAGTPESFHRVTEDEVAAFLAGTPIDESYGLRAIDWMQLYNELGHARLRDTVDEGLVLLHEIHRQGVYGLEQAIATQADNRLSLFQVQDESGNLRQGEMLSEEDALRTLRINLAALAVSRDVSVALFRILRPGLAPNLAYDEARTNLLAERTVQAIEPVVKTVRAGDTLVEPGGRVTPLVFEQLEAYRRHTLEARRSDIGPDGQMIERILMSIAVVLCAAIYLRTIRLGLRANQRLFLISGALIIFNLLLVRGILDLASADVVRASPTFAMIFPYLLPVAIGPIIIAILVGVGPAVIAAALIGAFTAMMQANSLAVLLTTTLSALIGVLLCRRIQLRARVVRAGFYAGCVMAIAALLSGIRDDLGLTISLAQMAAALGTGFFTGVVVVGLLPVWEVLFKYTTDITLLELTDFNHSLLRKMQVDAPGSYHHSLMVANLAENAAAAIGANPLVCRVCALFHDIGKMVKPEYFAENQRAGNNPHI